MNNNFTVTSNLPSPPKGGWGVWRRGSIWLFLELVVISVVAWVVIDPAVVNLYYRSLRCRPTALCQNEAEDRCRRICR